MKTRSADAVVELPLHSPRKAGGKDHAAQAAVNGLQPFRLLSRLGSQEICKQRNKRLDMKHKRAKIFYRTTFFLSSLRTSLRRWRNFISGSVVLGEPNIFTSSH